MESDPGQTTQEWYQRLDAQDCLAGLRASAQVFHRSASLRIAEVPRRNEGPTTWPAVSESGLCQSLHARGIRHRGPASGPGSVTFLYEQGVTSRWCGAQTSVGPARRVGGQRNGTGGLERHHASGSQRVHLLGRGCEAGHDSRTAHPPNHGRVGRRPATPLLLARLFASRRRPQIGRLPRMTRVLVGLPISRNPV
jgi:hypothetical protein